MVETGQNISKPTEVSCETCIAACCRAGTSLHMTQDEAYKHRRAMTLETVVKPKDYPQVTPPMRQEIIDANGKRAYVENTVPVPKRYGFFIMLRDCGNLTDDNKCGAYDERPKVCRDYEVGSQECLDARAAFGLDGHEPQVQIGQELPKQFRRVAIEKY